MDYKDFLNQHLLFFDYSLKYAQKVQRHRLLSALKQVIHRKQSIPPNLKISDILHALTRIQKEHPDYEINFRMSLKP